VLENEKTSKNGKKMAKLPKRWLTDDEQLLWRAYLGSFFRLDELLNSQLESNAGFDLLTYEILVNLSESPERSMRMNELAKRVSAQKSRLTYRITQLELDGWVERKSVDGDGRGLDCMLLDKGFAVLEKFAPMHVDGVLKNFIEPLEESDISRLTEIFNSIATSTKQVDCDK